MSMNLKDNSDGILFALLPALAAWFIAPFIPFVNSIMLGLLLGILIGNIHHINQRFDSGLSWTASKGLEWSIIFLSFSINYKHIAELGLRSFIIIAIALVILLFSIKFLSRKMKCPGTSGLLIGFGTAICGSSAIAALAPQLNSSKTDTGMAIAVVNLLGTLFMLLFPFILPLFHLNLADLGLLIGGSLHSVGNVAGAGYAMSSEIGDAAITIKLARVALLSPALILMHFMMKNESAETKKVGFKFPWYLWGFLIITFLNTFLPLPPWLLQSTKIGGEAVLTLAMTAIGMRVRILDLLRSGSKGLLFGLIVFVLFIVLISLGILLLG